MSVSGTPAREYWCFISYRHSDNKKPTEEPGRNWASWLHHSIETYEVPKDLVGRDFGRGPVPARIYPIFRDEDELPAGADLSEPIEAALRTSKSMLVLCSPAAVGSDFVDKEIRGFKALHPQRPVLAAILRGEPNVVDLHDVLHVIKTDFTAGDECFPLALRCKVDAERNCLRHERAEPVAPDFRWRGTDEGWTNAEAMAMALRGTPSLTAVQIKEQCAAYSARLQQMKLKVIAGILGVTLDDLVKRDQAFQLAKARRRQKMIMALAAVFGVLALAATGAGWFAWEKKTEAEIEREKQDKLLWQASRGDHAAATRAFHDGREQEGLAYLNRALTLQPKNTAALVASVNRAVGLSSAAWRVRPGFDLPGIERFQMSPTGKLAAVTLAGESAKRKLRFVELPTGRLLAELECDSLVTEIEFSADGRFLAQGGGNKVRIIDTERFTVMHTLQTAEPVTHVRFSADGRLLAISSDIPPAAKPDGNPGVETSRLLVLTAPDWKELFEKITGSIRSIRFCDDGRALAVLSADENQPPTVVAAGFAFTAPKESLHVIDALTGAEQRAIALLTPYPSTAFAPDGVHVAVMEEVPTPKSDKPPYTDVRILDLRSGATVITHHLDGMAMMTMEGEGGAFSPDGILLAVGSSDSVTVFESLKEKSHQRIKLDKLGDMVTSVSFSADGRQLGIGSYLHSIRVVHPETGEEIMRATTGASYDQLEFSKDGRWLVAKGISGADGVLLFEPGRGADETISSLGQLTSSLSISADERWAAVGVPLYDDSYEKTDSELHLCLMPGFKPVRKSSPGAGQINQSCFSPDARKLVLACGGLAEAGATLMMKCETLEVMWKIDSATRVTSAQFTPDASSVIIGTPLDDKKPDAPMGRLIALDAADGHEQWREDFSFKVRSLALSPDGKTIAIAGWENPPSPPGGQFWLIDAKSREKIFATHLDAAGSCVAFSADGSRIAVCSGVEDAMSSAGEVLVIDSKTRAIISRTRFEQGVRSVAFSPDARWLAATAGMIKGELHVLECTTGSEAGFKTYELTLESAVFTRDAAHLLAGGMNGTLRTIDAAWIAGIDAPGCEAWNAQLPGFAGHQFDAAGILSSVSPGVHHSGMEKPAVGDAASSDWLSRINAWEALPPEQRTVSPFSTKLVRDHVANALMAATRHSIPAITRSTEKNDATVTTKPAEDSWLDNSLITDVADTAPWHPLVPASLARLGESDERKGFLARLTLARLRAADVKLYGADVLASYAAKAAGWMDEMKLPAEAAEARALKWPAAK